MGHAQQEKLTLG